MDVPLVSPGLGEIERAFGISGTQAGLLVTVYALPALLVAPLVGMYADRLGRKRLLTACLVVFGTAGAAISVAPSFEVVLALRLVQGCASGPILLSLATTLAGDTFVDRRHDTVIGATMATISLGAAIYPAIGGYLSAIAWNLPFVLYGLAVVVAVFVSVGFDEPVATAEEKPRARVYVREAARAVPTVPAVRLYGLVFLTYLLVFGLYTALPFYLERAYGLGAAQIGLMTMGMLLVSATVSMGSGLLSAWAPDRSLLVGGVLAYASALALLALTPGVVATFCTLGLFGVGSGVITPRLLSSISTLAPDEFRAGVTSIQTVTISAGQAAGPVLFIGLGSWLGYQRLFGATAVVLVATTVGSLIVYEFQRVPSRERLSVGK
ncbi:MFS transporter [Natronobiforma cellulositropha]